LVKKKYFFNNRKLKHNYEARYATHVRKKVTMLVKQMGF
jgi:hypothetical protein